MLNFFWGKNSEGTTVSTRTIADYQLCILKNDKLEVMLEARAKEPISAKLTIVFFIIIFSNFVIYFYNI